jgi:hypothetical protein
LLMLDTSCVAASHSVRGLQVRGMITIAAVGVERVVEPLADFGVPLSYGNDGMPAAPRPDRMCPVPAHWPVIHPAGAPAAGGAEPASGLVSRYLIS